MSASAADALVALSRVVDAVRVADVALARQRRHHRVAQTHELVEVAHQLQRLLRRLAEARAGIEADAVVRDARRLQQRRPGRAGSRARRPPRRRTTGSSCMVRGLALHVHDHEPRIARRAPRPPWRGRGSRTRRSRWLAPASTAARATSAWRVSMLTHTPRCGQRAHHRRARAPALRPRDTGAAPGAGGLAAHVHDAGLPPPPCARHERARHRHGRRAVPPSEKESGVTFKMPMTMGILVSNSIAGTAPDHRSVSVAFASSSWRASGGSAPSWGAPLTRPHLAEAFLELVEEALGAVPTRSHVVDRARRRRRTWRAAPSAASLPARGTAGSGSGRPAQPALPSSSGRPACASRSRAACLLGLLATR